MSSKWILCVLAAVLMQQLATVSAAYSMEQTCKQLSVSYVADPSSCQSFGYCKNGTLVGTRLCPDGYIYHSRKGICDFPSSNGCTVANADNVCKYAPDKSFVADPNNCNRYIYCSNKTPQIMECPKYQIYDSKQVRCVYGDQTSETCTSNSICHLVPDGTFPGDPLHCGKYVACVNGVGPSRACEKGYFDKQTGTCQDTNPCQEPVPIGIGLGVAQPLASYPDACKAAKGTQFPQYVGDGKTCMGYFICDSQTGPGIWSKCPPGMHFNDGRCVTPYTFACTFDRCGNIEQDFVGAIGSQCHNYLYCKNQTSQATASGYTNYVGMPCKNNEFFNEYTGKCESAAPASKDYKLCV